MGAVDCVDVSAHDPQGAVGSRHARERDRIASARCSACASEGRRVVVDVHEVEYDLALVNASDSSLVGPFFLKINRVSSSIGPVSVRGLSEDAIIFTARHELLPPGEYTAPSHVRIQVSGDIGERLTAALDHNPGIGLIGRVYAACSSKPE